MSLVALESTVFTHGLPPLVNIEVALALEHIVRERGAEPRTIGVIGGKPIVGLTHEQIRRLAQNGGRKVSLRDLPIVVGQRLDGATTVAATAWLAHQHGIDIVCTGGLGGVHRGSPFDVSNDLNVLATTPITIVCSGPKAILDLRATRESLESAGVTVVGFGTAEFPAFYSSESGLGVDLRCDSVRDVAEIVRARQKLGLGRATLVVVPVPAAFEIQRDEIEPVIERAVAEASERNIRAANLTPFLLDIIATATEGRSLAANRALLENNAKVAAELAIELG